MRIILAIMLTCGFAVGCSSESDSTVSTSTPRGGTITIGEQSWSFVPSLQCSIYPNNQVNLSGHAELNPEFEIAVDYYPDGDGPIQLTGGKYGAIGSWRAVRDTTQFDISKRQVRGTATFKLTTEKGQSSVEGAFDISC